MHALPQRSSPARGSNAALVRWSLLALGLAFGCGARAQGAGTPGDTAAPVERTQPDAGTRPGDRGAHTRPDPLGTGDAAAPVDEDAPPERGGALPGVVSIRPGRQVVVLLPLSGRSARLGADLLAGLELSRAALGSDAPDIVVRDAPDGPTGARAVTALTDGGPIAGLVGVLDRASAAEVVEAAASVRAATVLVTPSDAAIAHPGTVWRALHTPSLAVRTVAGAGLARGGRSAFILRPRTPAAESYAALFRAVWAAGGGTITGEVDYDAAKPDWKTLVPRVTAQAGDTLFLPDAAVGAAQVLAQLASAGLWSRTGAARFDKSKVREVLVLGTPEWYAPEVMRQSGRYFEGALFPVPFAVESVQGARLATLFSQGGRAPPTAVDALLWESVRAVDLAARTAERGGESVASALARSNAAEVSVGLRFDAPDAVQSLFVLTVRDGRFTAAR